MSKFFPGIFMETHVTHTDKNIFEIGRFWEIMFHLIQAFSSNKDQKYMYLSCIDFLMEIDDCGGGGVREEPVLLKFEISPYSSLLLAGEVL